MIRRRKKAYYEKKCAKLKEKGTHAVPYKALKSLGVAERPPAFDPAKVKPHLTELELANDLANILLESLMSLTPWTPPPFLQHMTDQSYPSPRKPLWSGLGA